MMKKLIPYLALVFCILSCNNNTNTNNGRFMLVGEIKNVPDQKVYLEQLYFSQKNPEIIDTAELKKGKFSVKFTAAEEGLFRIRLEKMDAGFIFVNDDPFINFTADIRDVSLDGPKFDTKANSILKNFIVNLDKKSRALNECDATLDSLAKSTDTSAAEKSARENIRRDALVDNFKNFITRYIDTVSDPVVAMFALGFAKDIEPQALEKVVPSISKRFPKHQAVATMVAQFNDYIAKLKEPKQVPEGRPGIGTVAPDFTLNDTTGKPFSLSELKGKYVLVDFWASWCRPCRGENPNVVAAYNKYKDKNFTVLGVSLDESKAAWLDAIKHDKLDWKHVSDLKYWQSVVVGLYQFDGIPYNVLLDPEGKIIATELRGDALQTKLAEVLK